jgi:hypothetical protein
LLQSGKLRWPQLRPRWKRLLASHRATQESEMGHDSAFLCLVGENFFAPAETLQSDVLEFNIKFAFLQQSFFIL